MGNMPLADYGLLLWQGVRDVVYNVEIVENKIDYSGLSSFKSLVKAFKDTVNAYKCNLEANWLDNNILELENA